MRIQDVLNQSLHADGTGSDLANLVQEGTSFLNKSLKQPADTSAPPTPSQEASHASPPTTTVATTIGLIVGVVGVVLLLVAMAVWYRRRHSIVTKTNDPALFPTDLQHKSHSSTQDHVAYAAISESSYENAIWNDPAIVAVRIPMEKVTIDRLISRGGFGEVYRGTYKSQVVAIKKLLPRICKEIKYITSFFHEIQLMASLEHPQIVTFLGVAWDSLSDACAVTEFMEGGDLRQLLVHFDLVEHRPHGFDPDKLTIAFDMIKALTYLHSLATPVLHRDLKSKNVLLTPSLNAKLTDFGVSRERLVDKTMTAGVGTSLWMAPEVILGQRYDEKADMYSFGVVLAELDSHQLPFTNTKDLRNPQKRMADGAILQLVSLGKLRIHFSSHVSSELKALGVACTSPFPNERPTAAEALYQLQCALKVSLSSNSSI